MQHALVYLKRSNHSQWNLSYGNERERERIKFAACLASLPSLRKATLNHTKQLQWWSLWKNTCPCLQTESHCIFQISLTPAPQLHLTEAHSQPDEDVPETAQEFMEQPCGDARYKIWKQVFAVLCCIFFHFQTCIFVKQGFPADWLSSLNTEVDLRKVSFIVLSINAAPRIPDLLRKKQSHTD